MSAFEHLAVLVSIVLGLGITQLLASVHRVVQAGPRVTHYWLVSVWAVLIFISQIEWWWAIFALRETATWNFFYFLFFLLSPVTLYLAAAFVYPEIAPDHSYDLRAYYYGNRRWFFIIVALSPAFDAVRRGVEAGSITDFGAASNAASVVLLAVLAVSKRPAVHAVITCVTGGLFLYFIVSSALELR